MVQIRKITRSNPLSAKRRYTPQGGTAFRALGQIAEDAYNNFLEPLAIEEMKQRAEEDWTGYARDVMANNKVAGPTSGRTSSKGGTPSVGSKELAPQIKETAESLGMDPVDLATIISYETGGTFDPSKAGPTTQWGKHRGLIQFGEPQASQYGVDWNDPIGSQLGSDGAIAKYFRENGWQPEMGLLDAYSIVNAGAPGLYDRSDASNGGAPGTVRDKVENQMEAHRRTAQSLFADDAESIASDTMAALGLQENEPGPSIVSSKGPGVTVRTSDGRLEPRLFSPASGPILQAYNAAASVAALSEVSMQAQADLLSLSQQFQTNPEGFQEAAESYVESVTESFDERLRGDVRAGLAEEVQRRTLGIMDEQHRDTQRRADNSSRAMVSRLSQDHADALASGDEDEIARTQAQLDDVLYARERLPGVSWTPAQSENVFIEAQRNAEKTQAKRQADQAREWKTELNLIWKSRKEGMTAANEAILSNPAVWETHPDLARKAQAMVLFQNQVPSFQQMNPAQMDAAIADMEENPISDDFQIDILDAAKEIRDTQAKGFDEDAIGRADAVLENKPPEIGEFDPMNPEGFMSGLEARTEYVNETLVGGGYVSDPTYLSKDEAEKFSEVFSKDMPDEVRGLAAEVFVDGFGDAAADVFDQLDVPSEIALAGKLTASGGPRQVMQTVLKGQRMLDDGLVTVPASLTRLEAFPADFQEALSELPVTEEKNFAQVRDLARTAYAGTVAGQELTDEQKSAAMESSIQLALGRGQDAKGRTTGGVQKINDNPTWLPIGVSGEVVEGSLEAMASNMPVTAGWIRGMAAPGAFDGRDGSLWLEVGPEDAPPSLPYLGGEVLTARQLTNGNIQLKPDDRGAYRMQYVAGVEPIDVAREDGSIYRVDLNRLMEAVRP